MGTRGQISRPLHSPDFSHLISYYVVLQMINDGTTVVKRGKSEDTGVVIQIGWSENGNS